VDLKSINLLERFNTLKEQLAQKQIYGSCEQLAHKRKMMKVNLIALKI